MSTNSSQESLPIEKMAEPAGAPATETLKQPETRKQPWRNLPAFESFKDKVHVNKVRDMRLFGNHVNAHS